MVLVTLRLWRADLIAARKAAAAAGQPYQRWLRERIHDAVEAEPKRARREK